MKFTLGLDLGQSNDPTAIAITETIAPPPRKHEVSPYPTQEELDARNAPVVQSGLHLRHLERVKLGTPYPKIVERVAGLLRTVPLAGACELVVDATGVGRPVVDMFIAAGLELQAVTITGGNETTHDGNYWRVPKRDLVVGLQVLLQEGRLKIAADLPEAATFVQELLAFKVKIDAVTAHDSYNAREGAHDDLLLAAALAAWRAKQGGGFWYLGD